MWFGAILDVEVVTRLLTKYIVILVHSTLSNVKSTPSSRILVLKGARVALVRLGGFAERSTVSSWSWPFWEVTYVEGVNAGFQIHFSFLIVDDLI